MTGPDEPRADDRGDRLRRMAAVGFLTRSFAHEFNNVLGVVLGSAHLLAMRSTDPARRARLSELVASARQAVALSQSLGALARYPRPGPGRGVDLHAVLGRIAATTAAP